MSMQPQHDHSQVQVDQTLKHCTAIVVGGGPSGLMAAEVLNASGVQVKVYDAMPSVGRKFLLAGRGGLNLTHAESPDMFAQRFGAQAGRFKPLLDNFGNKAVQEWAQQLGIHTFVGSSQRVFPTEMKAAPLLRAWLKRLQGAGVTFHPKHRWIGWQHQLGRAACFSGPSGDVRAHADVVILALGGASWPRLGSDGRWVNTLIDHGLDVAPLIPSNCGFAVAWSDHFVERFAGHPLKAVGLQFTDLQGRQFSRTGEILVTKAGIEGGLIYAASAQLRDLIATNGHAVINIDLQPQLSNERITRDVTHPRGAKSLSNHLKSRCGIHRVKMGLLRECVANDVLHNAAYLAAAIKSLPLTLTSTNSIDKAISSAGGLRFSEVDANLMIKKYPGLFCAGEMLDWEAPTGGYLLTGCFASGYAAGHGAVQWLYQNQPDSVVACDQ